MLKLYSSTGIAGGNMKKLQNRNIFFEYDCIIFICLLFIKFSAINIMLHNSQLLSLSLIFGCIGSAFLLSSGLCLFKVKNRIRLYIIIDAIVSLLLFTDTVYNRYFNDVTSISLIKQAKLVSEVGSSVQALIHPSDIFYFFDIGIFILLLFRFKRDYSEEGFNIKKGLCMSLLFILMGISFTFASIQDLNRKQPGILKTLYDKKYITANIGDLNFHFFDLYRYITNNLVNKEKLSTAEIKKIKTWFKNKNTYLNGKLNGIMTGKNLIIVQLESFQGFLLNKKINGVEITPNLNKLSKTCLVFTNYHYQTAWGGTSDAEFLTNTSLLPAEEGAAFYIYGTNTYDSIIGKLKAKGYYTAVMHANRPGFWNRGAMYRNLGVDRFVSEKDYKIDDTQGLGLSDKSFFRQSVEKMKSFKKPFYSLLISLSSHFPYKDYNNKINSILNVGEFEGEVMGDYLKSVKYSDEAIGELIKELKSSGIYDNSVLVFYGDHSAIPYSRKEEIARLIYNKDNLTSLEWFNEQRVICMIHFPKENIKGENNIMAGQMDLAPTLGNIFGFKMNYSLGQDLLNAKMGFYVNNNGIFATNNEVFLKEPDEIVDEKSGKRLNKNKYLSLFKRALEYRQKSQAVLNNDLIRSFRKTN